MCSFLKKFLFGYDDEEGQHALGTLEELAPLGISYFAMPDVEPEIFLINNYASMYPWLHGEDDYCFEIELPGTLEEHDAFVAQLDANDVYTKSTKTDKINGKDVNVNVYKIENKPYVGNLTIEVTDYVEKLENDELQKVYWEIKMEKAKNGNE